jgi:hypothetical protein
VLLRMDFGSSCAGRAPQTGQRAIPFTRASTEKRFF